MQDLLKSQTLWWHVGTFSEMENEKNERKVNLMTSHFRPCIRGQKTIREIKGTTRKFLNLDDLIFLPAQIARFPLLDEEDVDCEVILGNSPSSFDP